LTFQEPARLVLFIVVAAVAVAYIAIQLARTKYTLRFTSVDLLKSVAPRWPGWQRHVAAVFMLLALGAMVVTLARPARTSRVPKQTGTILLAIDTSGSMSATDVAPTRLVAAESAATSFVNGMPKGLKVGLVQFDNTARLLVTPTDDRSIITTAIGSLTLGGGTATGSAITQSLAAINALPPDANGKKPAAAIVLMSDGSPTIGEKGLDPITAASSAATAAHQAGVPVDTIAFGTDHGVVTLGGQEIPVPADPNEMAQIASAGGGKSFTATSGAELNSIYSRIRNSVGYNTVKHDITGWFVGLAFLLALAMSAAGLFWMQRVL
jgi:Ca-activated chloride channel family protein